MDVIGVENRLTYLLSNLSIIRFFALWGILDTLVQTLTSGNKSQTMLIYIFIFVAITAIGLVMPELAEIL